MKKNSLRWLVIALVVLQVGCATGQSNYNNKVLGGLLAGATVGAVAGSTLTGSGASSEQKTRNTIISSIVFSLIGGGAMAWHHRQIENAKLEVSGRYARYRLCDPEELQPEFMRQMQMGQQNEGTIYRLDENQVGKLAITLDDSTKWVYPNFRKRYLMPERGETRVLSERYIWEIVKPGSFVTRSQNPEYFLSDPPSGEKPRPDDDWPWPE